MRAIPSLVATGPVLLVTTFLGTSPVRAHISHAMNAFSSFSVRKRALGQELGLYDRNAFFPFSVRQVAWVRPRAKSLLYPPARTRITPLVPFGSEVGYGKPACRPETGSE